MGLLLEGLAELIAPTRCAGCELPGRLLCERCLDTLPRVDPRYACPLCGAPYGHLICTECWNAELRFEAAVALCELDGAVARSVVLHKDAGERRLGAVLGALLAEEVVSRWPGWADVVTWVPPTDVAVRRRGFDHGRSLAEPIARVLGLPCRPLLRRRHARDQRALGRTERAANSVGTFLMNGTIRGRILVVDDVLTTGATLDAVADVLLGAGAQAVRGAVVARSW